MLRREERRAVIDGRLSQNRRAADRRNDSVRLWRFYRPFEEGLLLGLSVSMPIFRATIAIVQLRTTEGGERPEAGCRLLCRILGYRACQSPLCIAM